MKTPRELLLGRHQSAQPALDRARARALATLAAPASRDANASASPWWERLLGPNPLAWAGLAAVWLVLVALNSSAGGSHLNSRTAAAQPAAASKAALAETVRENRRQLAELLDLDPPSVRAPVRAPVAPKRSERRDSIAMA